MSNIEKFNSFLEDNYLIEVNLSASFLEMRGPRHIGKYVAPFLSKSGIEKTKKAFKGTGTPVEKIGAEGHGALHDPNAEHTHVLGSAHGEHPAGTPVKIEHVFHKDEKTIYAKTKDHGDIPLSKIQKPKSLATERTGGYGFGVEAKVAKNLGLKQAAGSSNKDRDFEMDHPQQKAAVRGKVKIVPKPKKLVRGESKLEKGRFGVTSLAHKDGKWGFTGDPKMHAVFAKATVNGKPLLDHLNKSFPNGKITRGFKADPHPGTSLHYLNQSDTNVLHIHDKKTGHSTTYTVGNSLKGMTNLGHLSNKEIHQLDGRISVEPSAKGKGRIAHSPNIGKMRELASRSQNDSSHRTLEDIRHARDFTTAVKKIKIKKAVNEDAPAMSMGAGIQGLSSAQGNPIAGFDPVMTKTPLRRKPPVMFGGKAVFKVPSDRFYKARMGKKKFEHYSSYVGRDDLGEEIRTYIRENPNAPVILEDETTGAMFYLKYGKR